MFMIYRTRSHSFFINGHNKLYRVVAMLIILHNNITGMELNIVAINTLGKMILLLNF